MSGNRESKNAKVSAEKTRKGAKLEPRVEEQLEVVREHVVAASTVLAQLGPDFHQVAWMLEDTLSYVDEVVEDLSAVEGKPVENADDPNTVSIPANSS